MDRNWTQLGVVVGWLVRGLEGEKRALAQKALARRPQAEDDANVVLLCERGAKLRGDKREEAASHWRPRQRLAALIARQPDRNRLAEQRRL